MFVPEEVAVVILNWNGTAFLEKFLPSVISNADGAGVIVIDNASQDKPELILKEKFPSVSWIHLDRNYGFCGGYNRGLAQLNYTYFVLLNSDVEVTEGWLQPLIKAMNSKAQIAACQPKIMDYYHPDRFEYAGAAGGFMDWLGYPFCRGRIFETLEQDQGQYNESIPVFWATGAAMCIRSEAFKQIGGFDERFFAHMEEIDLCWRLQNKGWKIYAIPESVVYHVGGGTLASTHPKKTFLNFRNNLLMLHKNLPKNQLFSTLLARLFLDGLAGLKFIAEGKFKNFVSVIKAHFAFYHFVIQSPKRKENYLLPETISRQSLIWTYYIKKKKTYSGFN